jgi:tetratricopeptide (TPR) repeat protein
MLHDVRYGGLAGRLAEESEMTIDCRKRAHWIFLLAFCLASLAAPSARASNITLTPDERRALDTIYQGDPDGAIALARAIQQAEPQQPEGYVIESEALWWKRYCGACEIKYGMIEAWTHEKRPEDEAYLKLADRIVELAKAQLAKSETAQMHFFEGMGYALKVRVYGLRSETRNAARAAVNARSEMLRALEIDPELADATAAMGVYNYYVDTLSPVVKFLRFFMGIPGGNKELGVKQMRIGMNQGTVLAVHVRFILARALRQYDQKYEEALDIAQPLLARYPQNPLFLLLLGNLNAELGRDAKAAEYFRQVQNEQQGSLCPERTRNLANSFLQTLH